MKPQSRILHIDIETFPRLGYFWDDHRPFNIIRQIEETAICGFSAKWHDGKQTTKALPDYRGYRPNSRNDKHILEDIWDFLDEAEVITAHNGNSFDVKKINARFLHYGMRPPSPYKQVDTLREVKKIAAADSNRLNELGKLLNLGEKLRTGGADLWFDCLAGDMKAWRHMKDYNAQDVILLEQLYTALLPWMKSHPNIANGFGSGLCPKCGKNTLEKRGYQYSKTLRYQRYKCLSCGSWVRDIIADPHHEKPLAVAI